MGSGDEAPWEPVAGDAGGSCSGAGVRGGARDSPRGAAWRRGARYKEGGGGQRERKESGQRRFGDLKGSWGRVHGRRGGEEISKKRDPSRLNKSRHEGKDFVMIIATTEASIIIATICPVFICASAGVSLFFFYVFYIQNFFTYFSNYISWLL